MDIQPETKQFIYQYEPNPCSSNHDSEKQQAHKEFNLKRSAASTTDDGSIPLNIASLTSYTALGMAGILLACGYHACTTGLQECSSTHLPDISHVMGMAPWNKLYAIMLTFYSCVKQCYVRAYHHRFNGIASKGTQKALLIYATLSCIFGPCIGFFDCYYNMTMHCTVTAIFVVGEVLYIFTCIGILNSSRQFFQGAEALIGRLVFLRTIVIGLGAVTLGAKVFGFDIGIYSAVIEWVLFIMSFYIFSIFSTIMPYTDVVLPKQD
jgi:hypothetical protein